MLTDTKGRRTWSSRLPLTLSFGAMVLMAALIGTWSVQARISGAVMGSGTVEVSQTMTSVEHPVGGVVEEIAAGNGDLVRAGDIVVRLDDRELRSELAVVEGNLFEVLANIARLEAAIDGHPQMDLHPMLAEAVRDRPEIASMTHRQQRQLDAHFESLETETRLLDEQIAQVRAQIRGIEAQIDASRLELEFVTKELDRLTSLVERELVKREIMYNTQKSRAGVSGEIGRLEAKIAELRGKISELELKRHTIEPKARELAVGELSKLRPDRTKYLESRATLVDKLSHLEIRAPISGRIHDSRVLGLRSVVEAAKPLMMIVPDSETAFVSVRLRDTDIDQVYLGQEATVKFTAFNRRHSPLIIGQVKKISANILKDEVTRKPYYEVMLVLPEEELAKLGDNPLLPGMPVSAFLSTESRTPINYVLRPLMIYLDRAFRDA